MNRWDVIVVGTGLAGLVAARTAAEQGAKVLLCGRGMGSVTLFGNTIDLMGTIDPDRDMGTALSAWIAAHPEHPYARTGWAGITEALAGFRELFPASYSFAPAGRGNSLLPTGAGTLRPAYLLPVTMQAGVGIAPEETMIVGFRGFKDFQGDTVALHLGCRGVNVPLPRYGLEGLSALGLARLMDEAPFREGLGEEIRRQMAGEKRIGLPAVLGLKDPALVLQTLEAVTGARIFEIPMLPPSIPGTRIFRRIREVLIEKRVSILLGNPVIRADVKNGRCESIILQNAPLETPYRADRFILATGRFLGGGLLSDMERISEPLFHLPVVQPASRGEWFQGRFFQPESHPIHRAGILTDRALRPVDEGGKVLLDNVRIAGSILAHHEAIEEHSREGIAIATGHWAAKGVLES